MSPTSASRARFVRPVHSAAKQRSRKRARRSERVHTWRPSKRPATPIPTPKPAQPTATIAVLPFANMSGDPDNEYFSDDITSALTEEALCLNLAAGTGPGTLAMAMDKELEQLLTHPRLGPLVRQLSLYAENPRIPHIVNAPA